MFSRSLSEVIIIKRSYYNAETTSLNVSRNHAPKIQSKRLSFWCTKIRKLESLFCQSACSRERVQVNLFELEQPGFVYTVVVDDACSFEVLMCYEHGARTVKLLKVVHGIDNIVLGVTHRILGLGGLGYFNMLFTIFQSDGTIEHLQIVLKQFRMKV